MSTKKCPDCGMNINTEDTVFRPKESNLVYLDKVYSYNQETASAILQQINTSTLEGASTELVFSNAYNNCNSCNNCCNCGCGCGCNCGCSTTGCVLDSNAVFTVDNAVLLVEGASINTADALTAADVTLEGTAVDSLTNTGGQYTASINSLLPTAQICKCLDCGLPSKCYFMIQNAGSWTMQGVLLIYGRVTTGGNTCNFVLKVSFADGIAVTGTSTFSIPKLAVPCSVNGVAPTIRFNFGANINVLNPQITVAASTTGSLSPVVSATLAVSPKIYVEVVRKTMFCLEGCEGVLPCDGSLEKYYLQTEEDDVGQCGNNPPCQCGNTPVKNSCGNNSSCGLPPWSNCNLTGGNCSNSYGNPCGSYGNSCGSCGNSCGSCGNSCGSYGSIRTSCQNTCGACNGGIPSPQYAGNAPLYSGYGF